LDLLKNIRAKDTGLPVLVVTYVIEAGLLGQAKQQTAGMIDEVAASVVLKLEEHARLRQQIASEQAEQISQTALAIHERLLRGGKLILFGNGGSATDANDWMLDCILPPAGCRPVPAVSLSLEPANVTALAMI
jgi:D-sedoheptulose 7-phosphate isomerase